MQSKSLGSIQHRGRTSAGATEKPFRSDALHDQRVVAEKQAKVLQERHNDVYDGYRKYQEEKLNEKEFIDYIEAMGITATPDFLNLLRTHRYADFSFVDFSKSLSKYDPNCQAFNSDKAAGGAASYMGALESKNREELSAGLFYARKRLDYSKRDDNRRSVFDKTDAISRKKLYVKGSEGEVSALQSKVQSSDNISSALKCDNVASQQMYSVAHDSMIKGKITSGSGCVLMARFFLTLLCIQAIKEHVLSTPPSATIANRRCSVNKFLPLCESWKGVRSLLWSLKT